MSATDLSPNAPRPRWQFPGLALGGLVALTVWVADVAGPLPLVDGPLYDAAVRLRTTRPAPPPAVLLVETPPSFEVAPLIESLRKLDAGPIVFTRPPTPPPSDLAALPGVFFSRPDAGATVLPPTGYGVARGQYPAPALEATVAAALLGPAAVLPTTPYYVNFRGGPGSLPHVTLEQVQAGRLVPELIRGRVVLVGPAGDPTTPGLATPVTDGRPDMTLLEFQGHALDTLLLGRPIRVLDPLEELGLLVVVAFGIGLLCQWLGVGPALVTAVVGLVTTAVAAGLLMLYADLWLPLAGLLLVQTGCAGLLLVRKAAVSHRAVRGVLRNLATGPQDRVLPPGFCHAPEPWALIVQSVTQAVDLTRFAFLEAGRGGRLREVAVPGSAPLRERRRDLAADPYARALHAGGAVRLDEPFFDSAEGDETYLVPLVFAGQTLGVWAAAARPGDAALPATLGAYAEEIAELLYRRRQAARANYDGTRLGRLLSFGREDHDARRLGHLTGGLERRLRRAERLFEEGATPVVAFDLFGRVREGNAAMTAFLAAEGLNLDTQTAADLIAALTAEGPAFARRAVRHLLNERRPLSLPVKDQKQPGSFLLRLSPLPAGPGDALDDPAPFRLAGIALEVVDRTALVQLYRLKDQFAGRLGVQLRNDLAAVELSASLLAVPDLSDAERDEMAGLIHAKVADVTTTLARSQQYFAIDTPGGSDRLPVDGLALLDAATAALAPIAGSQGVTYRVVKPDLLSFVLASPTHLQALLEAALLVLTRDARPATAITVALDEIEAGVRFRLTNVGFGLPDERLRDVLDDTAAPASDELRALQEAAGWVREWGGAVEAHGTVGEGIAILLRLPRFT